MLLILSNRWFHEISQKLNMNSLQPNNHHKIRILLISFSHKNSSKLRMFWLPICLMFQVDSIFYNSLSCYLIFDQQFETSRQFNWSKTSIIHLTLTRYHLFSLNRSLYFVAILIIYGLFYTLLDNIWLMFVLLLRNNQENTMYI